MSEYLVLGLLAPTARNTVVSDKILEVLLVMAAPSPKPTPIKSDFSLSSGELLRWLGNSLKILCSNESSE